MDPLETITTGGGTFLFIAFFLFMIVYAIIAFLMPFIVWGILRRTRATNEILEQMTAQLIRSQRQTSEEAKALLYQLELNVAALQRIKDSGDGILTHAQYQTEVTKHRLALDGADAPG